MLTITSPPLKYIGDMTTVLHNYTTTIQAQRRYGQHDANNITVIQVEKRYGHHADNKITATASTERIWAPCRQ